MLKIRLIFVFVSILLLAIPQANLAQETQPKEFGFTILSTTNGNQFVGEILSETETEIHFRDNRIDTFTINKTHVKKLQPEESTAFYAIKLNNGNTFTGKLIEKKQGIAIFETSKYGVLSINPSHIASVELVEGTKLHRGKHWFENPNYTRHLFAPTAIPMRKGEGYYQNVYVAANSADYGLTNNLTLGGGLYIPIAAYITPKFGVKVMENLYAAAGAIYVLTPDFEGESSMNSIGVAYGVLTFGNLEHNVTLASGYGFFNNEWSDRPIVTLNGMTRISQRFAFVTENWFMPYKSVDFPILTYKYDAYFSGGLRFMWGKFTIDAALINSKQIAEFMAIGIPYIDFVYKF